MNLIGQTLGQYQIISLLGRGGMASVYRARQESVHRDVAVKVIQPHVLEAEGALERFNREARVVASLSHPHILKVFDYGSYEGTFFLVMELMTGGSLTDLTKAGPLPIPRATVLLDQMASALDYAHRRGIVHRDLKPQNVLLDDDGNAFLTDFGLAKPLGTDSGLTLAGTIIGTPAYMSPEQWVGTTDIDGRSDIYALGIMLFEMLSGKLPYIAPTTYALMHKHMDSDPPLLTSLMNNIPPEVDDVMQVVLAKKPEERFASASDFSAGFKAALAGQTLVMHRGADGVPVSTPTPVQPIGTSAVSFGTTSSAVSGAASAPQSGRRTTGLVISGAVVVMILLIALFVGLTAKNNADTQATTQTGVALLASGTAGVLQNALTQAALTQAAPTVPMISLTIDPNPVVSYQTGTLTFTVSLQNAGNLINSYKIDVVEESTGQGTTLTFFSLPGGTFSVPTTGFHEGTYRLTLRAFDINDKLLIPPVAIKYNYQAPTVTPTSTATSTPIPTGTPVPTDTPTPTNTPAPSQTPFWPTVAFDQRDTIPPNATRLGTFKVEWYCNQQGYGVILTNGRADWACTDRNGKVVFVLSPGDFDKICQTTYNFPRAFAIRDQKNAIKAYTWSCFAYALDLGTAAPTAQIGN
jgi:tRNA A-37 threonylcarbamoyl transferase component Bud32